MGYTTTIVGVLAAVLGLGGVALSVSTALDLRRVFGARSPSEAEPGTVVVAEGTLGRDGKSLTAPLSGDRCAGYVLAQQLYYRWGQSPIRRWQTHRVWDAVPPFVVRGQQPVRVHVGQGSREPTRNRDRTTPGTTFSDRQLERTALSARYEPDESPPERVSAIGGSFDADHPHRYAEWRLDPDDSVTVVGELADANPLTITDEGAVFALSTGSVRPVAFALLTRTAAYLLFGLCALAIAAILLAVSLG